MDNSQPRILVVDDNRMERMKLSRALGGLGCAVTTAESGPLALAALRTQTFDLMLLDIVMPDMDGYEVLAQIRRDHDLRAPPIVVVSGFDDAQSVQSCIALGARAHLAKPVTADALEGCLRACLGNHDPGGQDG